MSEDIIDYVAKNIKTNVTLGTGHTCSIKRRAEKYKDVKTPSRHKQDFTLRLKITVAIFTFGEHGFTVLPSVQARPWRPSWA